MGIASRTKWQTREERPAKKLVHIDAAKLAQRIETNSEFRYHSAWDRMLSDNLSRKRIEACDKNTATRKRKAKARRWRGWLPFAKR